MNKIVNKVLLHRDKFMSGMHLRHLGFTYSACEPFTKNKEKIQIFKEAGDSQYIHQNEIDKACFQHDMVYGDIKDLITRRVSNKILLDKAFNVAKVPEHDRYESACFNGL